MSNGEKKEVMIMPKIELSEKEVKALIELINISVIPASQARFVIQMLEKLEKAVENGLRERNHNTSEHA